MWQVPVAFKCLACVHTILVGLILRKVSKERPSPICVTATGVQRAMGPLEYTRG